MANFNKHFMSGIILGVLFYIIFKNPWLVVVSAIYAVLPDIDINTSTPFRFYCIVASGYAIFVILSYVYHNMFPSYDFGKDIATPFGMMPYLFMAIPPLLGLIILQFVSHREWLHSLSAGFVFALPLSFLISFIGFVAGLLGYYLHLLLDNELLDGLFT